MEASRLKKIFIENSDLSLWEKSDSGIANRNLDKEALTKFVNRAVAAERLPEGTKPDTALLKQIGLINSRGFNNAGAAHFSNKGKLLLIALLMLYTKDLLREQDPRKQDTGLSSNTYINSYPGLPWVGSGGALVSGRKEDLQWRSGQSRRMALYVQL